MTNATATLPIDLPSALPSALPPALPAALHEHVRSLGRHLSDCRQAQGRFFGLSRLAGTMHGWVAPRFVTTLAVAAVCIALVCS